MKMAGGQGHFECKKPAFVLVIITLKDLLQGLENCFHNHSCLWIMYNTNHCILRIEMLMRFMFLMNVFSHNFVKFNQLFHCLVFIVK